jgi:pimeloyl-ACP methyl ester carboxylesterase
VRDEVVRLPDGRRAQLWYGGADRGPTVLFFHGCPDTRWAARTGAAAARDAGVRLLCVNRPGYGLSDVDASSHLSVAGDAIAVADQLGLDTVLALGMSVGGGYATALAAAHPDRVTALGVIATLASPSAAEDATAEDAMERYRPDFEEWVAGIRPEDPDDVALAARWAGGLPEPDGDLLRAALPTADLAASCREALADSRGYLRDAALTFRPWEHDVSAITCPTHLWYGSEDQRAMPGGEWLAREVPSARLVVRPGATHLATLLAYWPDVLAALLDSA